VRAGIEKKLPAKIICMTDRLRAWIRLLSPATLLGLGALGTALLWSYWPTFAAMAHRWAHDPVYSHGYLVPLFALVLLWYRKEKIGVSSGQPAWWWGSGLLIVGVLLRQGGAFYYFPWFEAISLLPCLAGLVLLVGGRACFAWSWPAIAFLFFMMPLPYRLETGMRQPLQRLATDMSTYVLQTIGCPVFAEGNVIVLRNVRLGVEEACSGLSMLLVFFALATAVALMTRRPLWEKCMIFLSAAPIAVIANVGRISATGLLYQLGNSQAAHLVFHDLAGWLMMPLGLALFWIELKVLDHLMVAHVATKPLPIILTRPVASSHNGANGKTKHRRRRQKA
jgi:exosortase